METRDICRNQS